MKAVFISNIPAPYQLEFCRKLNQFMQMDFVFCHDITPDRPSYWHTDLGVHARLLTLSFSFGKERFVNLGILKTLVELNPDVLLLGSFALPTCYIAYLWGCIHKKKIVVMTEIARNPSKLDMCHFLYRRIDLILAVGKEATKQYQQYFKKVINFSYAASLDHMLEIPRDFQNDKVRFLFSSRYIKQHNPQMLLCAFKEICDRYDNVELVMSSNGPFKEDCEKLVKQLHLQEVVSFWDSFQSFDDIYKLYAHCDILVFPATFSGWGLVIPEAMAAAMPIITTKGVLASELIPEERLISDNKDALVSAMEKYLKNPHLIREEGLSNREASKKESSGEKARQLHQIFQSLMKG